MSDERPASSEEAAEIVRNDPALSVATDDAAAPAPSPSPSPSPSPEEEEDED
jgi:hypothetical protein